MEVSGILKNQEISIFSAIPDKNRNLLRPVADYWRVSMFLNNKINFRLIPRGIYLIEFHIYVISSNDVLLCNFATLCLMLEYACKKKARKETGGISGSHNGQNERK